MVGCSANKRATWHLNRATRLNPSLLQERVIVKTDTVVTKEIVYADTVSFSGSDSVVVSNDTVETTIIKYQDKYIVKTKVKPYNIIRNVEVKVEVKVDVKDKAKVEVKDEAKVEVKDKANHN